MKQSSKKNRKREFMKKLLAEQVKGRCRLLED